MLLQPSTHMNPLGRALFPATESQQGLKCSDDLPSQEVQGRDCSGVGTAIQQGSPEIWLFFLSILQNSAFGFSSLVLSQCSCLLSKCHICTQPFSSQEERGEISLARCSHMPTPTQSLEVGITLGLVQSWFIPWDWEGLTCPKNMVT